MNQRLIIGTRSSKLALWQAEYVKSEIEKNFDWLKVELMQMTTKGDKILDAPLAKIGGKGLFTKELEQAMLDKEIDIAVHSLKDMPTEIPSGLCITAITKRLDAGDALVSPKYKTLDALPEGARVGTSSLRRRAQLIAARPDLAVLDGTVGFRDGDYRIFEHNDLNMVLEMQKTLAPYVGRFCISHMARTLHTDHAALSAAMAAHGVITAYDGLELTV